MAKSSKMSEFRQEKEKVIKEINKSITNSSSIVAAEYHGLTVKELQDLRAKLKENDASLKVYKNRLFKLALKGTQYEELANDLTGPNIFAFGGDDSIAPAKIISNFSKEHDTLKLKAGTFDGKYVSQDELIVIGQLPSYEEALTMLATSLLGPIRYIGSGLNMLTKEGHIKE